MTRSVDRERPPKGRPAISPDEATSIDQVRGFLALLTAATGILGTLSLLVAVPFGDVGAAVLGIALLLFAGWLMLVVRPRMGRAPLAPIVMRVAIVLLIVVVAGAYLEPVLAPAAATAVLIPIAVGLPYLRLPHLRRLVVLIWLLVVAASAAALVGGGPKLPPLVAGVISLVGTALASGLVLFLLVQSTSRLTRSAREFERLTQMSADLAMTFERREFGGRIARHLAEATGFDEGITFLLDAAGEQLIALGASDERIPTVAQALSSREARRLVISERRTLQIDTDEGDGDPIELTALRTAGLRSLLLLPLEAGGRAVGLVELRARRAHHADSRALALARTLAAEAAITIENMRLYEQLRHQALHDGLTGLANRALFLDRTEQALARLSRRPGGQIGLLYVDLDDFKGVNDRFGHDAGDVLLVEVAGRLRRTVRASDTVGRLGGDEFVVLLDDPVSAADVTLIARRIIEALQDPVSAGVEPVPVGASIGVVTSGPGADTAEALLRRADRTMYAAKRQGKGGFVLYRPGLKEPTAAEHDPGGSTAGPRNRVASSRVASERAAGSPGPNRADIGPATETGS